MTSAYLGGHISVAKTQLGSKIFVDTRDRQIAPHILLDGEWESWTTRVIHPQLKNSVFFDIGANYGWYCLVARHAHARKIVAFEPNPYIFELLSDTIQVNGIAAELHQKGLSDASEVRALQRNPECPGSSTFLVTTKEHGNTSVEVDVVPLDDVADDLFKREPELLRAPVVLKVDVEGFEPKVIQGARKLIARKSPPVTLFVEHHPDPDNLFGFKEMLDFLEQQEFMLNYVNHDESIERITRDQLEQIPDAEMLCFRRFSM